MPLSDLLNEFLTLIYPLQCVSCGKGEVEICPPCENELVSFRDIAIVDGKPLYSSILYNETSSHLILSAKESNDRAASQYLASLMAMRFNRIHRELQYSNYIFIPIPSSKKADKRRGFSHTVRLSKFVAKQAEESHDTTIQTMALLTPHRPIADQSKLTAHERKKNMDGAYIAQLPRNPGYFANHGIVLVDDLVTTGSTMCEAIRALRTAGIEPDALLSACVAGHFFANKIGTSLRVDSAGAITTRKRDSVTSR